MKKIIVPLVIVVIVLIGVVYFIPSLNNGSDKAGTPVAPATTTENEKMSESLLGISSHDALGKYLVAKNGMTLYLFTKDTEGKSVCYGDCAVKWPPYTVSSVSELIAGAEITGVLGTTTRTDGSLQVTYKGVPLYYWYQDVAAGDTKGQGVGGVWYVVQP